MGATSFGTILHLMGSHLAPCGVFFFLNDPIIDRDLPLFAHTHSYYREEVSKMGIQNQNILNNKRTWPHLF